MESAKLDIMIKEVAIHFMGLEADMRRKLFEGNGDQRGLPRGCLMSLCRSFTTLSLTCLFRDKCYRRKENRVVPVANCYAFSVNFCRLSVF